MLRYGLKRQWFKKNAAKTAREWFENQKVQHARYCALLETTAKPDGYLITLGAEQGQSAASVLYQYYDSPSQMIYVNYLDKDALWFVFAREGQLSNDYVVPFEALKNDASVELLAAVMSEIAFFDELFESDSVTIICNETRASENRDTLALLDTFEINTPFHYQLISSDFSHSDKPVSNDWVLVYSDTLKFPSHQGKVLLAVGVLVLVVIIAIAMNITEQKKIAAEESARALALANLPPIIVDQFKGLKHLLTKEGVGIKQRFSFIIEELFLIGEIKGYQLSHYHADGKMSLITLNRSYGSLADVKKVFPEHIFAYQPFTGGVKLARQINSPPIFNTAVRANINAEKIWLEEALKYVWGGLVTVSTAETVASEKGNYSEITQTLSFEHFSIQDLDSLASLYVGRSIGFVTLSLVAEEKTNFYKGKLDTFIAGITEEKNGT